MAAAGKLYSCRYCRAKGLDAVRFCTQDAPAPLWTINGEVFTRCPVQYVRPESIEALQMYAFYEAGHLFVAGGILDQPYRLISQMQIIAAEMAETRRQQMERQHATYR